MNAETCKYVHLDASIQTLADADDVIRVQHILKDIYINHPQAVRIQQFLEHLLRMPKRYRPTGLFISAPSGQGKTHLLRKFERRYPGHELPRSGGRRLPVLYVEMHEQPQPMTMYMELLSAAGVSWDTFPRKMPAHERVMRALEMLETQIVLLDEIHNMCASKHELLMRKWLRMLSNRLRIPIVLAGDESFGSVFEDFQLSSRWPFTVELPIWSDTHEFQLLLNAWERAYPLKLSSNLTSPEMRGAILKETMGITDLIGKCLSAAAIAAIRLRRESITKELLSWWRDPPAFDVEDRDTAAIARAWLADERATPTPLGFVNRSVRLMQSAIRTPKVVVR